MSSISKLQNFITSHITYTTEQTCGECHWVAHLATRDMCSLSSKTAWRLKEHLAAHERAARETVMCETYKVVASTDRLEKVYAVAEIKCLHIHVT